mgnify:CR=1 FL=1
MIKYTFILSLSLFFLTDCKQENKNQKLLLGKWEMIDRKYECPDTSITNKQNRYSDFILKTEKYLFEFTNTTMKSFGNNELLDVMKYELEEDSLILISADSKNQIKEHLNFSTEKDLILTEKRTPESNCILVAHFRKIN